MSGEFGEYHAGYFHDRIDNAATDLAGARAEISRKWADFFKEFYPIARAISWCEAGDSGESHPILESIERIGKLQAALAGVDEYLRPFREVARNAVENEIRRKVEAPK